MSEPRKLSIPMRLIIMDAIGAVLLGVGVAELFANTNLVPAAWRFENYAIVMIILGIALMLPIITYMLSGRKSSGTREV